MLKKKDPSGKKWKKQLPLPQNLGESKKGFIYWPRATLYEEDPRLITFSYDPYPEHMRQELEDSGRKAFDTLEEAIEETKQFLKDHKITMNKTTRSYDPIHPDLKGDTP